MIGLIDSGVGGLSVLGALEALLPHEDFLYFADLKHFPYGSKSAAEIKRYLSEGIALLMSKGASVIVIACHAASASIDEAWKRNFPIPILDMIEPTLSTLIEGKLGMLTTEATLESGVYQKAIPDLVCVSCPELAEKIQIQSPDLQETIRHYTRPFIGCRFDGVILGCTHYTFAYHEIEEELDLSTRLLNPTLAAAQKASRFFRDPKPKSHSPKHTLLVSKDLPLAESFLKRFPLIAPFAIEQI